DREGNNGRGWAGVVGRDTTDLSIVKTASNSQVTPGEPVTYTLDVTNGGRRTATDVLVSDPLPAEVSFVSASPGCTVAAKVVTCRLGKLAAGAHANVTIKVKPNPISVPPSSDTPTLHSSSAETKADVPAGQSRTLTTSCANGYVITDGSVRLDDPDDDGLDVRSVEQTSDRTYTATVR